MVVQAKRSFAAFSRRTLLLLASLLLTAVHLATARKKKSEKNEICHVRIDGGQKKFKTWYVTDGMLLKHKNHPDYKGRCNLHCDKLCDAYKKNKCLSVKPNQKCEQDGCQYNTKNCNDNDASTVDTCDPVTGTCLHQKKCDDKKACTVDTWDPVTGTCLHQTKYCDDNIACTIDTCDSVTGACTHVPDHSKCNDNNEYTTDTCDVTQGCLHVCEGTCCKGTHTVVRAWCDEGTNNCCDQGQRINGHYSCEWVGERTVCQGSCNGEGACLTVLDGFSVGYNSCLGNRACYYSRTQFGSDSCVGDKFACFSSEAVSIGDNSCKGNAKDWGVCHELGAGSSVGTKSCIGVNACTAWKRETKTIGDNSCIGENSCDDCASYVIGNDVGTCP